MALTMHFDVSTWVVFFDHSAAAIDQQGAMAVNGKKWLLNTIYKIKHYQAAPLTSAFIL